MRLLLIVLIAVAAFAAVQSYRHNCKFGESGWFDCVLGQTATTTTTPTTGDAAPAPEPAPSPSPSPQP